LVEKSKDFSKSNVAKKLLFLLMYLDMAALVTLLFIINTKIAVPKYYNISTVVLYAFFMLTHIMMSIK